MNAPHFTVGNICESCGKLRTECLCPPCPVCNAQGDPNCMREHGLTVYTYRQGENDGNGAPTFVIERSDAHGKSTDYYVRGYRGTYRQMLYDAEAAARAKVAALNGVAPSPALGRRMGNAGDPPSALADCDDLFPARRS